MNVFHLDFNYVHRTPEQVKKLLRQAAACGYDAVLWELEDQVAEAGCPEIGHPDVWSREQFQNVLKYASGLGLEAIPLLQTLGHSEYVMKHARYAGFREDPEFSDCYCVSNPEVQEFLLTRVREMLDTFGKVRYFHLGGDEVYRFAVCPECSSRDRGKLYAEHIMRLAEPVIASGARPGIWGDMLLKSEEITSAIPRDFVIWDWEYLHGAEGPVQEVRYFSEHGFDTVVCSTVKSNGDGVFAPDVAFHLPNVCGVARLDLPHVIGKCTTAWSVRLNPLSLSTPLFAVNKLVSDRPGISYDEVRRELSLKYFGFPGGMDEIEKIGTAQRKFSHYTALHWRILKDSAPAPAGYLRSAIRRWEEKKYTFWADRRKLWREGEELLKSGIAGLSPYASGYPLAAEWIEAARYQLRFLDLVRRTLEPEKPETLAAELKSFREDCRSYFSREETSGSVDKNTALVIQALVDYVTDC